MLVTVEAGPEGKCPVQAFGTVGDTWWYFRARGHAWQLSVGAHNGDQYVPMPDWAVGSRYKEYPEAGWMETDEAAGIITGALLMYMTGHVGGAIEANPWR